MRSLLRQATLISDSSLPINKMDFNTSHASKAEYWNDHLKHLEQLLDLKPRPCFIKTHHDLIQEEKQKGLLQLRQIPQTNTSAPYTPSASASPFQDTN
jgi:hypothetical protein